MNLDILDVFIYLLAATSLVVNGMMVWYIRKLIQFQEDTNAELVEDIEVFHEKLEALLKSDVFMGEPSLTRLLDDIREFGDNTEDIRLRLIPDTEEKEN